jgi:hypothetical protein
MIPYGLVWPQPAHEIDLAELRKTCAHAAMVVEQFTL